MLGIGVVKDLHQRTGRKRFWEEEQERLDLGMCCLILSCSLWEVQLHAQGRSPFHLSSAATFIKTSNSAFCRQKEFVYSFKTVH